MAPRKSHEKQESSKGLGTVVTLELPAEAAKKLVDAFRLGIFPSPEMKEEFPITDVDFAPDDGDDQDTR